MALPLKKHINESFKDARCQDWLKLTHSFWRRKLKFYQVTFTLWQLSLFEKGLTLHLNKLEFPPHKDAIYQVWLKSAQWFWKRLKCEKFTDKQIHRQTTDDRRSEKPTWAFGSDELKRIPKRGKIHPPKIIQCFNTLKRGYSL